MLIKEIGLRNIKSFGNFRQTITLNLDKGELILLAGRNGAGKSSILESIDFTFFKKVKGKSKKSLPLTNIPNRINKELVTDITFVSENNEYRIERTLNPTSVRLSENGNPPDDKAGASIIEGKIQKIIGLDYETFKSFISMSINDFKNFISLSNEEKKLLLDKLFNLEYINLLNAVLKNIVSETKKETDLYDKEISTMSDSIDKIRLAIEKSKENEKTDLDNELKTLEESFLTKKALYTELKEKLQKIKDKQKEINDDLDKEKTNLININNDIKNIENKLKLYENNKCGECEADLKSHDHEERKNNLINQKAKLVELKTIIIDNGKTVKERKDKIENILTKNSEMFSSLTYELNGLKDRKAKILGEKDGIAQANSKVKEFENTIKELSENLEDRKQKKVENTERISYQKILSDVLGESGIKTVIINNIIEPINVFISENIQNLNLPLTVEIDENFDATISHLGDEIDPESLSTGETRKVNLAIMIAYLKLIRTKISINVLFLDEVFSSIDVESINDVISLLRVFANEYNINIFLVHHSLLDKEYFDRIIEVKKDIFSSITEVNYNEIEQI